MVVDGKSLSNSEEVSIRGSASLLAGTTTREIADIGCRVGLLLLVGRKREAVSCRGGAEGEIVGCGVRVLVEQFGVTCGSNDAGMMAHLSSSFVTADRVLQAGRPASS